MSGWWCPRCRMVRHLDWADECWACHLPFREQEPEGFAAAAERLEWALADMRDAVARATGMDRLVAWLADRIDRWRWR